MDPGHLVFWRVVSLLVLTSAWCGLAGCGGRKIYPVEGQVVWSDGTPAKELAGGMVQFDLLTENAKERISPQGGIQEDGSYRLGSLEPGDGAPVGKYRVLVVPLIWTEGMSIAAGRKPAPPPVLDPRFQTFETSGIEAVVEAKRNIIPIKLERIKKR